MKSFFDNIAAAFSGPSNIIFSILDMLLTIMVVYAVTVFLQRNNATRLIKYLVVIVVVAMIVSSSTLINMPVMSRIATNVFLLVIVGAFIMFSQELKRTLWKLSSPKNAESSYTTQYDCSDEQLRMAVADIVRAVQNMSKKDIGALIVIAPDNIPESILESGTTLNAELSSRLLECLFNTKAPLHDGAVYIRGNKVLAAGCFLPLTQQIDLDKDLGTRHRAAIGVTEQYKHLAIIVSEETGIISVARDGAITRFYDSQMLTEVLEQAYGLRAVGSVKKSNRKKSR